ncbi:FtsQ-type POTRA domain-containing protein [bacterium]|nr:MAG: FtsQ-type POTRA domain-containing protein [bacterium]
MTGEKVYMKTPKWRREHDRKVQKKNTLKNVKRVFLAIFFLIIISGSAYLVLFFPYLKVQDVSVIGASAEINSQASRAMHEFLDRKVLKFLPTDGIFLFDEQRAEEMLSQIPTIKSADVKWKMPNFLKVEITGSQGILNWCLNSNCFSVDADGKVTGDVLDSSLPIVNETCSSGEYTVNSQKLQFITNVKKEIKQKMGIDTRDVVLDGCFTQKLALKTDSGFDIYFNTSRSYDEQILVLQNIFETMSEVERTNLEYIDLQVANKVFYR